MELSYYRKYEPFFGTWFFEDDKSEIGTGSFASVFRIVRKDADVKPSALKIMTIPKSNAEIDTQRSEGMDDISIQKYYQNMVDDIKKEYELMSELKGCSNVVSCEDFMAYRHEDGFGFDIMIRMEMLTPLINFERENDIDEMTVIKLGIDMCSALERCSIKNIIHRDIKPDNIFISSMGDFKLGDFGIARTMDNVSMMMSRKGTPNYMAPEVYFSKPYDSTADIYSLGIVLYRMLNENRIPFLPLPPEVIHKEDREKAFMSRIKGEIFPRPCNGDEALKSIVLKACAYRSGDRYQHPTEMRKHLEMVRNILLRGESVPLQFSTDLDATVAVNNNTMEYLDIMQQMSLNNSAVSNASSAVSQNTGNNAERKLISANKRQVFKFALIGLLIILVPSVLAGTWLIKGKKEKDDISGNVVNNDAVQKGMQVSKDISGKMPDETAKDARLDVSELDAKKAGITDLSELKYYKNLKNLSLKNYGLKNTDKLSTLTGLTSLNLNNNSNLKDLDGISDMSLLTDLKLRETAVSNIDVLKSLKLLKSVDISYTLVEDISSLKECKGLEVLYAGYNNENFTDKSIMAVIGEIKSLKELDLTGDTVVAESLDKLSGLTGLISLKLGGTFISDKQCKYLKELEALEVLDLKSNINITDFKFIKNFAKLKELNLSATGIVDIKGIENLVSLEKLDLSLTFVEDISMIGDLKNLRHLVLTGSDNINKQVKDLKKKLPACEFDIQ